MWSLAYRRLPHDSSTRALDLYRSIGYERLQLETAETQLVCGIYFQCSPREHWMVIKKKFFPFFSLSFLRGQNRRRAECTRHSLFESADLCVYIYRNCLDFYIPMMYEIYANICHEHGSTDFFFTRAFLSFNGSQLYEENLTLRFRQTQIEIRPESGRYQGTEIMPSRIEEPIRRSTRACLFSFLLPRTNYIFNFLELSYVACSCENEFRFSV